MKNVNEQWVLLRDRSGWCSGGSGEPGEPRVISAWVEAASLLTDLGTKKKEVVFNYQHNHYILGHFAAGPHPRSQDLCSSCLHTLYSSPPSLVSDGVMPLLSDIDTSFHFKIWWKPNIWGRTLTGKITLVHISHWRCLISILQTAHLAVPSSLTIELHRPPRCPIPVPQVTPW